MIIDLIRRGGLWAKHMGLKQGAIGNIIGEHIGNLIGTLGALLLLIRV
jgi:hypothetical protein